MKMQQIGAALKIRNHRSGKRIVEFSGTQSDVRNAGEVQMRGRRSLRPT